MRLNRKNGSHKKYIIYSKKSKQGQSMTSNKDKIPKSSQPKSNRPKEELKSTSEIDSMIREENLNQKELNSKLIWKQKPLIFILRTDIIINY